MAFTTAQRAQIRKWLGASSVYFDSQPLLENAMTQVGTLPDTQALVEAELAQLEALDAKLQEVGCLGTVAVGNIQMDGIRAHAFISSRCRVVIGRLARHFALNGPIRDAMSSLPVDEMDMPMLESGRRFG